jgi:hypothetical protein
MQLTSLCYYYGFIALCWDLGHFFSFLIVYTVGRTPCTGDQPFSKTSTYTQNNTNRINTALHLVWSQLTILVFEWAETIRALDHVTTVINKTNQLIHKKDLHDAGVCSWVYMHTEHIKELQFCAGMGTAMDPFHVHNSTHSLSHFLHCWWLGDITFLNTGVNEVALFPTCQSSSDWILIWKALWISVGFAVCCVRLNLHSHPKAWMMKNSC